MANPVEEQRLLTQACNGDSFAFDDLQLLLEPPIRRFVRRLIGGYHDSEDDMVQDTFISLYKHMHRIDPISNLRPYVYRIARNRVYDELRSQGRTDDNLSLDDEPTQVWVSFIQSDNTPAPDDATHWMLLYMEVREAMDNLPDAQREALILFSEENLSYAEIAEVTGVTVGTVKSRLFHAKRNLRRFLSPQTLEALEEQFDD